MKDPVDRWKKAQQALSRANQTIRQAEQSLKKPGRSSANRPRLRELHSKLARHQVELRRIEATLSAGSSLSRQSRSGLSPADRASLRLMQQEEARAQQRHRASCRSTIKQAGELMSAIQKALREANS